MNSTNKEELKMFTGRAGCKEFVKAFLKESGIDVNLTNFIKIYKLLIAWGYIKRYYYKP